MTETRQQAQARIKAAKKKSFGKNQKIKLATGVLAVGVSTASILGSVSAHASEYGSYTVKKGDSLVTLAAHYHVTVEGLKEANNLHSSTLYVGEKLNVPVLNAKGQIVTNDAPRVKGEIVHKIVAGDSVWKLANEYHVSASEIEKDNFLVNDELHVGRNLEIYTDPALSPVQDTPVPVTKKVEEKTVTYTVAPGDTLNQLAERFGSTKEELMSINHMKSVAIIIGQKLEIPAKNTVTTKATIMGAADNTSVEFIAHYVDFVLEVSYGQAQKFEPMTGKEVTITFTKGTATQRPALVSVK